MANRLFLVLFFLCLHLFIDAAEKNHLSKVHYHFANDPIDAVIVCHPKDQETLNYCIEGIRENCQQVRRIIVVSPIQLTDKCEWFDEKNFPFTKEDVVLAIGRGDQATADKYFHKHWRPPGWYFQQLLKLYAPFIIPGISSNVLIVDADTVFLNPVKFLNHSLGGLFCFSDLTAKQRYLKFAERLVPGVKRIAPKAYGVCHHMLFQRPILEDLFKIVEKHYHTEFWNAFCSCVNLYHDKGASEYQAYYTFALNRTKQVGVRKLKWTNSAELSQRSYFKSLGYHFVSFHDYMREQIH